MSYIHMYVKPKTITTINQDIIVNIRINISLKACFSLNIRMHSIKRGWATSYANVSVYSNVTYILCTFETLMQF